MQLSVTTDYGIRVVLYLVKHKQIIKSTKLSEELNIPKSYILKVTKKLERAGIVTIYQGVNGGVKVVKDISKITLWDVISALETTTLINKCLDKDGCCTNASSGGFCRVRNVYVVLQQAIEDRLQSIKLVDLIGDD